MYQGCGHERINVCRPIIRLDYFEKKILGGFTILLGYKYPYDNVKNVVNKILIKLFDKSTQTLQSKLY